MFTGMIEETGSVKKISMNAEGIKLAISAEKVLSGLKPGDSVSVDGCCLTVTSTIDGFFTAYASSETIKRTIISKYSQGGKVNLERAVKIDDRFDGHFVQGHIDGTGKVESVIRKGDTLFIRISYPEYLKGFFVEKGAVAINGASLTITNETPPFFEVSIIPYSASRTNLGELKIGNNVNIETDILGKYVARMLHSGKQSFTEGFLGENGFLGELQNE